MFLLAIGCTTLVACETTPSERGSTGTNSEQQNTSALPWNRPQSWEGPGAYGSMMGGSH